MKDKKLSKVLTAVFCKRILDSSLSCVPGLFSDVFFKCIWEIMNKILKSGMEILNLSTESMLLPHVELFQKVVYYARDFSVVIWQMHLRKHLRGMAGEGVQLLPKCCRVGVGAAAEGTECCELCPATLPLPCASRLLQHPRSFCFPLLLQHCLALQEMGELQVWSWKQWGFLGIKQWEVLLGAQDLAVGLFQSGFCGWHPSE